jgi:hypothetical protein
MQKRARVLLGRLMLVGVRKRRLHEGNQQGEAQKDGTGKAHRTTLIAHHATGIGGLSAMSGVLAVPDGQSSDME